MPATTAVHVFHGAVPGTPATVSTLRHKRADNDTRDHANMIPIPSSGRAYGWRKYTKLYLETGLVTQIGNIRWFAEAAPPTWDGTIELYAGTESTYVAGTASMESGPLAGHTVANVYASATPLTVTAALDAITQNGSYGDQVFVVAQLGVLSTATPGIQTPRSIGYRYDES